jgi:hypothetical protein
MAPKKKFECVLCMELCVSRIVLECKHEFCFHCVKKWQSQGKRTCPYCRGDSAVLASLKTRCPPLTAEGVSRVAVKRPRKQKKAAAPEFHSCIGCNRIVEDTLCSLHAQCGKRTCNTCHMILYAANSETSGCVPCLCDELGLTEQAMDYAGAIAFLGLTSDGGMVDEDPIIIEFHNESQ